ncbi:MAG TPA: thiol:disulfide interchange protein DsbA/DsbL [Lysobacter sp.]|nr:thiol:disulfide interchange protein DsbA/DsbL [Lysobacter sp.]
MRSRPLTRLFAPALLLVLALAGCKQDAPAEADTAQSAPSAPATGTPADAAPATTPAEATATTAPAANAIDPADAPPPPGPAPVAGTHYVDIPNGQPFAPTPGMIEVVEVFGYTCPHCAQFEPVFESWRARQPRDVKVTLVAAPFGGYWLPYAKAYYASETMGLVEKTHQPMFRAVHVERSLPVQPLPSDEQIGAFYAKFGANPQQFISTMSSFAVDAKMKRATQFMQRSGVESTPTLVVAGKYRIEIGGAVNSHEEMLRIAEHLVARERAAAAGAAAPATSGG